MGNNVRRTDLPCLDSRLFVNQCDARFGNALKDTVPQLRCDRRADRVAKHDALQRAFLPEIDD